MIGFRITDFSVCSFPSLCRTVSFSIDQFHSSFLSKRCSACRFTSKRGSVYFAIPQRNGSVPWHEPLGLRGERRALSILRCPWYENRPLVSDVYFHFTIQLAPSVVE
jgi:hypothetical protein